MDADAGVDDFEVDAVAFGAEAVEFFAAAGDEAEAFAVGFLEVVWGDFEFGEEVELEQRVELAHFCGADFVEDDLEHDGEGWEGEAGAWCQASMRSEAERSARASRSRDSESRVRRSLRRWARRSRKRAGERA